MRAIRFAVVLTLSCLALSVPFHVGAFFDSTPIQIGYARLLPDTGATSPIGTALFGYSSGGILISEANVPTSALIPSGRIFVDVGGVVNTGITIANPGSQDAIITFYFTNSSGQNFGSGSFTLFSKHQIAALLTDAPFNGLASMQGTFTFSSSTPVSAIALRGLTNERGDFLTATLPVLPLGNGTGGTTIAFPQFLESETWNTQFVLINPGNTSLTGSVQFWGQGSRNRNIKPVTVTIGGSTKSSFPYTIPPRSAVKMTISTLLNNSQVGSIKVVPQFGQAPSSVAIFSFQNAGVTVSTTSVTALPAGNAFRTYIESSGVAGQSGAVQTGLTLSNASSSSVTAQLTMNNMDGSAAGLSTSIAVPAGGEIAVLVNNVLALPANFKGVLRITTKSPISASSFHTRYNERSDLLVTAIQPWNEANSIGSSEVDFPHIVNGGGYSTEIILLSSGGFVTSGTLSLMAQDGTSLSTVQLQPLP